MRTAPLALVALTAATLSAQVVGEPPPPPPGAVARVAEAQLGSGIRIGKEGFVLPVGEIDIRDLIDAAARFLQRNILYRAEELAQANPPLTFQKELAVDAVGCEEVLCQLLYVRGLVLLTLDAERGLYEVVSMMGPRAREVFTNVPRRTVEEVLRRPALKQAVFTEVQLKHINANIATNALRPFFASAGGQQGMGMTFGTAGGNQSILVTGFQDQVARAIRMLQACDVAGNATTPPDLESRLQNFEARIEQLRAEYATLVTRLNALATSLNAAVKPAKDAPADK